MRGRVRIASHLKIREGRYVEGNCVVVVAERMMAMAFLLFS